MHAQAEKKLWMDARKSWTKTQRSAYAHILQRGVLNPGAGSKYAMCAGKRGTAGTKTLTKCFICYVNKADSLHAYVCSMFCVFNDL